jgi:transposase InsO family protein
MRRRRAVETVRKQVGVPERRACRVLGQARSTQRYEVRSGVRRRAERPDHAWSHDLVFDRAHDGRPLRRLTLVDEYTRECLAIDVTHRLGSENVLERLAWLFVHRGTPDFIRSDDGPESTAHAVRGWPGRVGVETLLIEPGSPWENGHCESFNGKLRDECLNGEISCTLREAQVITESWRRETNGRRPHGSLACRSPAPEAFQPGPPALAGGSTW